MHVFPVLKTYRYACKNTMKETCTYLADGSSGVAGSVESVCLVAHSGGKLSHLSNAAGVVRNGSVHVDGEASLR